MVNVEVLRVVRAQSNHQGSVLLERPNIRSTAPLIDWDAIRRGSGTKPRHLRIRPCGPPREGRAAAQITLDGHHMALTLVRICVLISTPNPILLIGEEDRSDGALGRLTHPRNEAHCLHDLHHARAIIMRTTAHVP